MGVKLWERIEPETDSEKVVRELEETIKLSQDKLVQLKKCLSEEK